MNDCCLCNEIRGNLEDNLFARAFGYELVNAIVFETQNFAVIPSLGHLVEGYLLIVPKEHLLSIGALSTDKFTELSDVIEQIRSLIEPIYGPTILFEHGPASPARRAGCCTDHAHLHIVPAKVDLLAPVRPFFLWRPIHALSDLKAFYDNHEPYLFIQGADAVMHACPAPLVPSQFLRKALANCLGKPREWDWRSYPAIDGISAFLSKVGIASETMRPSTCLANRRKAKSHPTYAAQSKP